MTHRKLTLLFGGDYDRTRHLQDPEIAERHGLKVDLRLLPKASRVFHALTHSDDADGGELSLSFYTTMASRRDVPNKFVALPVFVSRFFRHGNILVNRHAGITEPAALRGKVFGVPEYGSTMVVWLRGMLEDEYGVSPHELSWRTGREPVALGEDMLRLPDGVDVRRAESDDLLGLLNAGQIDAYIGLVPDPLPPNVVRLFPDYGAVERAYYQSTGIFPIMHVLVLRRSVYEADPAIAEALFHACVDAKAKAIAALSNTGVLSVTLPWLLSTLDEQTKLMGGDLWPYGVKANRKTIETFIRYAYQQGLLWDRVTADDLFLPLEPL